MYGSVGSILKHPATPAQLDCLHSIDYRALDFSEIGPTFLASTGATKTPLAGRILAYRIIARSQ
jgi:hypothetical protein